MSEQAGFAPVLLDDTLHEDLESVYQENAVAVYRRIFARVRQRISGRTRLSGRP